VLVIKGGSQTETMLAIVLNCIAFRVALL